MRRLAARAARAYRQGARCGRHGWPRGPLARVPPSFRGAARRLAVRWRSRKRRSFRRFEQRAAAVRALREDHTRGFAATSKCSAPRRPSTTPTDASPSCAAWASAARTTRSKRSSIRNIGAARRLRSHAATCRRWTLRGLQPPEPIVRILHTLEHGPRAAADLAPRAGAALRLAARAVPLLRRAARRDGGYEPPDRAPYKPSPVVSLPATTVFIPAKLQAQLPKGLRLLALGFRPFTFSRVHKRRSPCRCGTPVRGAGCPARTRCGTRTCSSAMRFAVIAGFCSLRACLDRASDASGAPLAAIAGLCSRRGCPRVSFSSREQHSRCIVRGRGRLGIGRPIVASGNRNWYFILFARARRGERGIPGASAVTSASLRGLTSCSWSSRSWAGV